MPGGKHVVGTPWTREEVERLRARLAAEVAIKNITREFGVSMAAVCKVMSKYGLTVNHPKPRWSAAELRELRRLHWRGLSAKEIARATGRSFSAVQKKCWAARLIHKRRWTPAEAAELRALNAAGRTTGEIARRLNRGPRAIRSKCRFLGIKANHTLRSQDFIWTFERRAQLAEMLAEGRGVHSIAAVFGLNSTSAIMRAKRNFGLAGRRKAPNWTDAEREELAALLRDGKKYAQIARDMNRTHAGVRGAAKRLGLAPPKLAVARGGAPAPAPLVPRRSSGRLRTGPWTVRDDVALRAMVRAGAGIVEITTKLNRPYELVSSRRAAVLAEARV